MTRKNLIDMLEERFKKMSPLNHTSRSFAEAAIDTLDDLNVWKPWVFDGRDEPKTDNKWEAIDDEKCDHHWVNYLGLAESFEYCYECGERKHEDE